MGDIEKRLKEIKLLAMDFDGVFTNNKVWVDSDGREQVVCDRSDSLGLKMLKEERPGINMIVISKETDDVVRARCSKLSIPVLTGVDDKGKILSAFIKYHGKERVAYIGNDLNDIDCIEMAGIGIAVADAAAEVRKAADYITMRRGGDGAIREIVDIILDEGDKP